MDNRLVAEIKKREIPRLYTQENTTDPMIYLEISLFNFPGGGMCRNAKSKRAAMFCFSDSSIETLTSGVTFGFRSWKIRVVPCWSVMTSNRCRFPS
jgi:gentisate 1,2-dioxygenase